jgi:DNA-binding transcriptional LysR family regulator
MLARWHQVDVPVDDLNMEPLFDDPFIVAAGKHSHWVRRRKVDLAEIAGESWILPPSTSWNYECIAREFRKRGLGEPKVAITTFMGPVNAHFVAKGAFLTSHPRSWALHNGLAVVPVDMPLVATPIAIVTLKHRTLSPLAERFAQCARDVAKSHRGARSGR